MSDSRRESNIWSFEHNFFLLLVLMCSWFCRQLFEQEWLGPWLPSSLVFPPRVMVFTAVDWDQKGDLDGAFGDSILVLSSKLQIMLQSQNFGITNFYLSFFDFISEYLYVIGYWGPSVFYDRHHIVLGPKPTKWKWISSAPAGMTQSIMTFSCSVIWSL